MKNKYIILIVGVVVFAFIGLFVWWRLQPTPKYLGPIEKIRLVVSSSVPDLSTLIWIADSEGYFKTEGLDVNISQETTGLIAQEKVATGSADIATTSDFAFVSDSFIYNNLRIIASIDQANVIDVVARKDRGISSPSDLKGKRIGLPFKLVQQYFFGQFLVSNGISPTQVTIIDTPVVDQKQAILSGNVDAVVVIDPTAYEIKTSLGEKYVSWSAQSGQDFDWPLVSSDLFVKNHPQAVDRFLQSIILAHNFLLANPEKSKQFIENKFGFSSNYINQNWPKHKFEVNLDQDLLVNMENEARFMIMNNITKQILVPNYLNYIYFDALTRVAPDSVSIVH
jgi:ABC-type nitrate/sulfonate/bicarbonate transport system substrate-binding protein